MVQREGRCATLMRCVLEFSLLGLMTVLPWVVSGFFLCCGRVVSVSCLLDSCLRVIW